MTTNNLINPSVWVLTDEKPGNRTQAIGVAQKLPWQFVEHRVLLNRLSALPNMLLGSSGISMQRGRNNSISAPWPNIAIAAGRRLAPILRYIKKQNPNCFTAYMMNPQTSLSAFDLVAIPQHDNPPAKPNVITTIAAPHSLTTQQLTQAYHKWSFALQHLPKPKIAVLVGGNSGSAKFQLEDFHILGKMASKLAIQQGGSLLISTSRRTGKQAYDYLRLSLEVDHELFGWNSSSENPYLGFLSHADAIIVTGDSISMCAEACSLGKAVFIFSPPHGELSNKLINFHKSLFDMSLAKPLTLSADIDWQPNSILDEAARIAGTIVDKFKLASNGNLSNLSSPNKNVN